MDLSLLDTKILAEQGTDCILNHPGTGEPLDIIITVYGSDSKKYQSVQHAIQNRQINSLANKKDQHRAEKFETDVIKKLAACTIGWINVFEKGVEIDCTEENALKLYTDYRWISDQLVAHIENRANFLPNA